MFLYKSKNQKKEMKTKICFYILCVKRTERMGNTVSWENNAGVK